MSRVILDSAVVVETPWATRRLWHWMRSATNGRMWWFPAISVRSGAAAAAEAHLAAGKTWRSGVSPRPPVLPGCSIDICAEVGRGFGRSRRAQSALRRVTSKSASGSVVMRMGSARMRYDGRGRWQVRARRSARSGERSGSLWGAR